MKPVAVIGGGITGLTAAFRLQQQNVPVTVYEAGDRVGGVIESVRRDGYLAEFGPNTILETSLHIAALVDDLGLARRRLYSDPSANNRYLVRGGRLVKMPESPLSFIRTPLFSPAAKFRLLFEPFVSPSDAAGEETVAQFVERRLGREFLDRAVDALVAGIYAGEPRKLSLREAFPRLFELEQKYGSLVKGQIFGARERKRRTEVGKPNAKKFSFDEGLRVLPETLQAKLRGQIQLRSPVKRLCRTADDWIVTLANGTQSAHSAVIYAGTAFALCNIDVVCCQSINSAVFREIRYPPVASVVLGFRRQDVAHPLDGFGMLIPKAEGFRILGTIFSSSLFPNRAPADCVMLTSYVGGTRAPGLAHMPAKELFEITCQDLGALLGVSGQPTFKHHVLFPRAIPQYDLGYGRFKKLLSATESSAPGIFFAGQYRGGIAVSDCIASGQNAANRVAEYIERNRHRTRITLAGMGSARGHMGRRGVLLVNLGSPDSPTVGDVRKYLREFLMDERVLDVSYLIRFGIVHLGILPTRPKQSAEAYQKIWTSEGSPLIMTSRRVCAALKARIGLPIELGMRYRNPSIERSIERLRTQGVTDLFLIPLFPHYAMSSYGTAVERVRRILMQSVPEMSLSVMPPFYDHPDYISALVGSAAEDLAGDFDHLLFSFHGLPERHLRKIEPSSSYCLSHNPESFQRCAQPSPTQDRCYRAQCFKTVEAFADMAGLPKMKFSVAFQSRLGREPWLKPYTDHVIARLGARGVKKLLVICPAFVTDCLETLEEIGIRGRETFHQAGGEELTLIPCLNEHPLWIAALEKMINDWRISDGMQSAKQTTRSETLC